jgi:hypothetical protein
MFDPRKVEVSKKELLLKLKENKTLHIKEFKETQEEYNDACILKIEEMLSEAKKRPKSVNTIIHLNPPKSHVKEYEDIIGMLEFSTQTTLEITMEEYKSWVLNEWEWTRSFAATKMSYVQ